MAYSAYLPELAGFTVALRLVVSPVTHTKQRA